MTYDWIVVGGGLAGSALSYELANAGFSVLLIEQFASPSNGTRFSYGGIAYWSGTTTLTRTFCREGIELHRTLTAELDADTQFRETDLLLVVDRDREPESIAAAYAECEVLPKLLSPQEAHDQESLIDRDAISGVLHLPQGHVSPEAVVTAYRSAFQRSGGHQQIAEVTHLLHTDRQIQGVQTGQEKFYSNRVVLCAGGASRGLLKSIGQSVRLYYTQAEIVETPPIDLRLRSIVMPAELKRFSLEAEAGRAETDALWDQPGQEVIPAILDIGAVQFQDGRLRLGQISRTFTDLNASADATTSEAEIRSGVGHYLPALQDVPGTWRSCLVSFSGDRLPLVGAVPDTKGLDLFAGFSNPFAILPPIARRFARSAAGTPDELLAAVAPARFMPGVPS